MARQSTDALSYYPEDTRESDSEQYIESIHGAMGYMVLRKLRKHIYGCSAGYYAPWSKINQAIFCKNNGITVKQLTDILESCFMAEIDLFDKHLYNTKQILTSHGIQKRWRRIVCEAHRKNIVIKGEYNLLTAEEQDNNGSVTTVKEQQANSKPTVKHRSIGSVTQPKSTQSKVKEIKEKENKGKKNGSIRQQQVAATPPPVDPSVNGEKKQNTGMLPAKIPKDSDEVQNCFFAKMKNKWDVGFISMQALKFFNFYEANGWKQGKGKPIVNWESAANGWILRTITELTEKKEYKPPAEPPKPLPVVHSNVPREQAARPSDDQTKGFINSLFAEWCAGTVKEENLPPNTYTVLAKRIAYTADEREKILNDADQDERAAKQKGLALYFEKLKAEGVAAIYELAVV